MNKLPQTIIDGAAVFGAGLLATWIRFDSGLIPIFHNPPPPQQPYIYGAIAGAIIMVIVLHAMKTYEKQQTGRLAIASLLGVAILIVASFLVRIESAPPYSRLVLHLAALFIPLILIGERLIISKMIDTEKTKNT